MHNKEMVCEAIWTMDCGSKTRQIIAPTLSGAASDPASTRPGKTAQFSYELVTSAGLIIAKQVSRYLPDVDQFAS